MNKLQYLNKFRHFLPSYSSILTKKNVIQVCVCVCVGVGGTETLSDVALLSQTTNSCSVHTKVNVSIESWQK